MQTANGKTPANSPKQTGRILGIIALVAFAATVIGIQLDGVNHTRIGPSWSTVNGSPDWSPLIEKLFTCMVFGFLAGSIPGLVIGIFMAAWVNLRREEIARAEQLSADALANFGNLDKDGDGLLSDADLVACHCGGTKQQRDLVNQLIRIRGKAGTVFAIENGRSAAFGLFESDLKSYPDLAKRDLHTVEWKLIATFVLAITIWLFLGPIAMLLGGLVANAITMLMKSGQRSRRQTFLLNEFNLLDSNGDGIVDELEIVKIWLTLAKSQQLMVADVLNHIGEFSHDIRLASGLTVRGFSRIEVERYTPARVS